MIDTSRLNGRHPLAAPQHELIDGTYDGREARDLVQALIDSTINAHKLRNLTSQVNTESPNGEALQSIRDLRATREALDERLGRACTDGLRIRLRTTIELDIEDDAPFTR